MHSRVQIPYRSPSGDLAQLGERLPYKQRVSGSSPLVPTILSLVGEYLDPLAQSVEHLTFNQRVRRSNRLRVTNCECSSMVELQPSKLTTWVRFPSLAPFFCSHDVSFFVFLNDNLLRYENDFKEIYYRLFKCAHNPKNV